MTGPPSRPGRPTAHIVLTALGALGLPALLLPFSWDVSPYRALEEWGLWSLPLPAFLVAFILPASIRWIVTGAFSARAQVLAWGLAAGSVVLILLGYLQLEAWPDGALEWLTVVGPLLILGYGAHLILRLPPTGLPRAFRPVMALQVAYIANAFLALASTFPDWQLGAYLVLITMCAYAIQIDVVRKAPDDSRPT